MTLPKQLEIADFSYDLPLERIASHPLKQRDMSKLLVSQPEKEISGDLFKNIATYLPSNSLMVFNNTRVVQARLKFKKPTGATIEIFCLEPVEPVNQIEQAFSQPAPVIWKCFVGNAKKWKNGCLNIELPHGLLTAEKVKQEGAIWYVKFSWHPAALTWAEVLEVVGRVPLPPYIKRDEEPDDKLRYQTVFARKDGSVAAPTAGLHFTDRVFDALNEKFIRKAFTTLHVGAGTFKPVKSSLVHLHEMHQEQIAVDYQLLENLAQYTGSNITAVGTTTVRTLESIYWYANALVYNSQAPFFIQQWQPYQQKAKLTRQQALELLMDKMKKENEEVLQGVTQMMIAPGYQYRMLNAMVTNFHQPQSTLLLLVAAFVGNRWKEAYQYALSHDFRFLSYGDACLFFPDTKDLVR